MLKKIVEMELETALIVVGVFLLGFVFGWILEVLDLHYYHITGYLASPPGTSVWFPHFWDVLF